MSALGQKRTLRSAWGMSALPPKADIGTQPHDVRFVPKADMLTYFIEVHSLEPVGRVRVIGNAGQDVGYG